MEFLGGVSPAIIAQGLQNSVVSFGPGVGCTRKVFYFSNNLAQSLRTTGLSEPELVCWEVVLLFVLVFAPLLIVSDMSRVQDRKTTVER